MVLLFIGKGRFHRQTVVTECPRILIFCFGLALNPRHAKAQGMGHPRTPSSNVKVVAAVASTPSASPAFDVMVLGAFRSPALAAAAAGEGLSSGDVVNWVMQK